ncbi:alkene reductase [Alienimonas californiensis]|uniref:N-ethylmaleimide reductase n=1 Tax=Alienimonas californiensis TaxID=2527989 RepID=A0A517P4S0_9PLAN|nr:alkene reductase [Alienimonas californiensis]QDT14346.1 N-ethylmaleimide reductase [Alienimonas californiensis]
MSSSDPLFNPLTVGDLEVRNRVWMAPLTRCRSLLPGHVPWQLNAAYYRERATGGLLFSEATEIAQEGRGYPGVPGLFTDAQVAGWRKVTAAVHESGGLIACQLWHVGRASHQAFQPGGKDPVAPSAIAAKGDVHLPDGSKAKYPTPRALAADELPGIVATYRTAAENAKAAGFDAVELHGANGYLIDEFLRNGANHRTDEYGGSVENRCRFPLMVIDALIDVWGKERVGIRVSPLGSFNDMTDSDPLPLYSHFFGELQKRGIAFLEIVGAIHGDDIDEDLMAKIDAAGREQFNGTLILNGGYTGDSAREAIASGKCDAITFGTPFLANPDLPRRLREGAELNESNPNTWYTRGAEGYVDYPSLDGGPVPTSD